MRPSRGPTVMRRIWTSRPVQPITQQHFHPQLIMHSTTSYMRVLLIIVLSQIPVMAAPRIGVLLKDRDLFFAAVQKGAEEEGKALNVELSIKAPSKANAPGQQLTLLAALEKEPLDALVISPLAADDFKEPVARLVAKRVKIVALDSPLPEGLASTFLRYDQKSLGEAAAAPCTCSGWRRARWAPTPSSAAACRWPQATPGRSVTRRAPRGAT